MRCEHICRTSCGPRLYEGNAFQTGLPASTIEAMSAKSQPWLGELFGVPPKGLKTQPVVDLGICGDHEGRGSKQRYARGSAMRCGISPRFKQQGSKTHDRCEQSHYYCSSADLPAIGSAPCRRSPKGSLDDALHWCFFLLTPARTSKICFWAREWQKWSEHADLHTLSVQHDVGLHAALLLP